MWGPIWKITKIRRLGDVAQAVELLSSKYQGPEFKPSTAKKRQGGWDSCFISYWFPNLATINKLFFNPSRYFVQLIYADIVFRGFLSFLYFYPKGSTPQSGFKYFLCLALCAELFFFPHVRSSLPFPHPVQCPERKLSVGSFVPWFLAWVGHWGASPPLGPQTEWE
jgi:hypothetical protein